MAKFRLKPRVVDAFEFDRNLADGFEKCDSVTCGVFNRFGKDCSECKYSIPYINTPDGCRFIKPGDYIVIDGEDKYVFSKGGFIKLYEPYDKN